MPHGHHVDSFSSLDIVQETTAWVPHGCHMIATWPSNLSLLASWCLCECRLFHSGNITHLHINIKVTIKGVACGHHMGTCMGDRWASHGRYKARKLHMSVSRSLSVSPAELNQITKIKNNTYKNRFFVLGWASLICGQNITYWSYQMKFEKC